MSGHELKVGSSTRVSNSEMPWSELFLWNISYLTTVCRIDQCQMWTLKVARPYGHGYDLVAVIRSK